MARPVKWQWAHKPLKWRGQSAPQRCVYSPWSLCVCVTTLINTLVFEESLCGDENGPSSFANTSLVVISVPGLRKVFRSALESTSARLKMDRFPENYSAPSWKRKTLIGRAITYWWRVCKSGLFQRGWRTLRESSLSAGLSITARVSVLQPTLGGRKVQIVLLTNTAWLKIQWEGWELRWLWMALVVHSATVHPPPSSKQAKVTSGSPGLHILWLVVYVMWRWEQRVVDAYSKEGISSSYCVCVLCVCVCVSACVCVRAHVLRAWVCPVCMCICVTAMRLMLQLVCSLLSRKWKLYCSEHARFKSLLPPYVLIKKKRKKHKLKDVSPAKTPRRSRREFQINVAWPEKDIWTNANADKMAAVAKLTGGGRRWSWMLFEKLHAHFAATKAQNTHRQSQNFSHLARVARAAKSSLFCFFFFFFFLQVHFVSDVPHLLRCAALKGVLTSHLQTDFFLFKKPVIWFY